MVMLPVLAVAVRMALCVTIVISGSSASVCYTNMQSLDLGCLLRWDCPGAGTNARYTVQTKTQGDPWKDVPWCERVSSSSCDISLAFSDFDLYYMVRVGVHLGTREMVWNEPRKFDYSDFTFSPPSVTVSLNGDRLSVQVQFPCAASRRCSMKSCCPVSELIDPWITVTIYHQLNSEYKSCTVWTQDVVISVEFTGLAPGQDYCAVANFSFPSFSIAASPKSLPQCVATPPESVLVCVFLAVALLCSAAAAAGLIWFLLRQRPVATATEDQPKAEAPVPASQVLVPPSPVPVELGDIHVQLVDDRASTASSDGTKDALGKPVDCVMLG